MKFHAIQIKILLYYVSIPDSSKKEINSVDDAIIVWFFQNYSIWILWNETNWLNFLNAWLVGMASNVLADYSIVSGFLYENFELSGLPCLDSGLLLLDLG